MDEGAIFGRGPVTSGAERIGGIRRRSTLRGHTGGLNQAVVAPDGQLVASAADDDTVRLWQLSTGRALGTLTRQSDSAWSVAFSPDGSLLIGGGKELSLFAWSMPSTTLVQEIPLAAGQSTLGLAFSPDGRTLASAVANGNIQLWQVARPRPHAPLPAVRPPASSLAPGTEAGDLAAAVSAMLDSRGDAKLLEQADALVHGVLARNPKSAPAYAALSRLELLRSRQLGKDAAAAELARARDDADRAIALDPKLAEGYVRRGWAAKDSHDPAGAHDVLAKAIALAPSSPSVLLLQSDLAREDGDLDKAEAAIRDLLSRPVDVRLAAQAMNTIEQVYWAQGDFDAAEEAYRQVIALEPNNAWAKSNYAEFLLRRGDTDGAIAMARQALAIMTFGQGRRSLADAYCAKGEGLLWDGKAAEDARAAFDAATAADPRHARAAYDTGAYHQYLGTTRNDPSQIAQARIWFGKAFALDAENKEAKAALAALGG